jgi:uncharacterized protein (DUF427 family)
MPRATWGGVTLAESDQFEEVEGNIYFPPDAVRMEHLVPSDHHTVCGWKGTASYYHVVAEGKRNENAAWFYPSTRAAAANIEGYVAFWKGVAIEK